MGLLSACDRAEKDQTTSLSFSIGDIGASSTNGLADMNCVGVFVSGPEKELQKNQCTYSNESASNSGGFSYGHFYGPFYKEKGVVGSPIEIKVPNGSDRVLRLVGVKVDVTGGGLAAAAVTNQVACENLLSYPKLYSSYMDAFYTIAESKPLQLNGDDVAVDLKAVFDSSKEFTLSSCSSFQIEKSSGVPNRIKVSIQDDRLNVISKTVSSSNCIGVKFQLQDSDNQPATSTTAISAEVTESIGGTSIGNFYYPVASPSLDLCAPVNLAPVVSGKVALSFAAGTTDNILYFRPVTMGAGLVTIEVAASGLKGTTDTLSYVVATRVPSKYAFYDLFTNTSSVKSTSLTPATIRRNQCRFGAVQFLDQYLTPFERSTTSFSPDTIQVKALPLGSVDFFLTQSSCAANSGASSDFSLAMPVNATATGYGFFYRVNATAPSAISFEIKNREFTPYPVIPSGDLSSGDNLWKIAD
jgi:hypothetical protein